MDERMSEYTGWEITLPTGQLTGWGDDDWDGIDREATIARYDELLAESIRVALPGALVVTYGNRVIVEEPDGSNEDVADEIERIENLIGELDSSLMSERTSEWMISLAPADDRAAGITQGCVYCIAGAPCESDHSDGLT